MNGAYGCKLTEHIELHAPQTQGVAGNRTWNIYMTAGTTMHRITSGMIASLFTQQNVNNLTSSNTTTYSYYFINSPYTFATECVPSGKKMRAPLSRSNTAETGLIKVINEHPHVKLNPIVESSGRVTAKRNLPVVSWSY